MDREKAKKVRIGDKLKLSSIEVEYYQITYDNRYLDISMGGNKLTIPTHNLSRDFFLTLSKWAADVNEAECKWDSEDGQT